MLGHGTTINLFLELENLKVFQPMRMGAAAVGRERCTAFMPSLQPTGSAIYIFSS